MSIIQPARTVVSIFGVESDEETKRFLGTGSFIGRGDLLITAHHVIKDWKNKIIIQLTSDKMCNIELLLSKPETDLSIFRVNGYRSPYPFPIAKQKEFHTNNPVICLEYGTTQFTDGKYYINPATRFGNITRIVNFTEQYGLAGEKMLELSFPALKGASGAAIVQWLKPHKLFGIVIANVSYHLLPSQIESVLDEKNNLLEETKFMLPQALAVNAMHIKSLLDEVSK